MTTLTREEREIILRIADDEDCWHVFTDSKRAVSNKAERSSPGTWGRRDALPTGPRGPKAILKVSPGLGMAAGPKPTPLDAL